MLENLSTHIATELEAKYYWASAAPKKLVQELLEKSLKSMENCTWRQAIYNLFRCDLVSVIIIMHQDMQDHILWISSIHKHCYFMGSNLTELVFHFDYWLLEYCTRQKRIQLSIVHIYFLQYVINHSYHQKMDKDWLQSSNKNKRYHRKHLCYQSIFEETKNQKGMDAFHKYHIPT